MLKIIKSVKNKPNIINDYSKFVIITYWWGRNNYNKNTARPCISFYENIINRFNKIIIDVLLSLSDTKLNDDEILNMLSNSIFLKKIMFISKINNFINNISKSYINLIYQTLFQDYKVDEKKIIEKIEKMKLKGLTSRDYVVKDINTTIFTITNILYEMLLLNYKLFYKIFKIKKYLKNLKTQKSNIYTLSILQKIKNKQNELMKDIEMNNRKYILKLFINNFEFIKPITYDDMILNWKNKCIKNNCNFLSIEYNFTNYQMAINAKPEFIKHALDLCKPRAVVYIDGDMTINHYPHIFDLNDIDFMARGWWIDPRSSYKLDFSIMFDPYTFETSGGTMYFSQTNESKKLINLWIKETNKPINKNKADDRILSLLFNSNKLLCEMKIIQLPIEYLWLSMDYDERMMEYVYDYDYMKMTETIFIEHPECLTSEETAREMTSANNDRQPKYYSFIEYTIPTTEILYEYIFFPNYEMTNSFKTYLDYMSNVHYIDDGNEELYKKNFVFPNKAIEENEQPLYMVNYKNKFGNKLLKYDDEFFSRNDISNINYKRSLKLSFENLNQFYKNIKIEIYKNNLIIIKNINFENINFIPLILFFIINKQNVIYIPEEYKKDTKKIINYIKKNKNIELAFYPIITGFNFSDYFKPHIDLTKPIYINYKNNIIEKYISMFFYINELSNELNKGMYFFISRIRLEYFTKL
jgi:hypothetical protein